MSNQTMTIEGLYDTLREDWLNWERQIPWGQGNSAWTKWVVRYFGKLGHRRGYHVESEIDQGEYMVDLCWWKRRNGRYWLELVLESEWLPGIDEIDHDFYKLVDLKATLKVWVCSYGDKQMQIRTRRFSKIISEARFKSPEEQYLVLNLPQDVRSDFKNRFKAYGLCFDSQGELYQRLPEFEVIRKTAKDDELKKRLANSYHEYQRKGGMSFEKLIADAERELKRANQ